MMQHPFKQAVEKWLVFGCTVVATSSLILVVAMLVMQERHLRKRGIDIVFTGAIGLMFLFHRSCIIFGFKGKELYLTGDSYKKLCNIFMLAEFCSLTLYIGRVTPKFAGLIFGVGLLIIIILQEADPFNLLHGVVSLILNNIVLVYFNFILPAERPKKVNMSAIHLTALWYILSVFGFLGTLFFSDFYLLADDVFMFATGMSLFYSWQTYEDTVYWAREVLFETLNLPITIKEMAQEKRRQRADPNYLEMSPNVSSPHSKSKSKLKGKKKQKLDDTLDEIDLLEMDKDSSSGPEKSHDEEEIENTSSLNQRKTATGHHTFLQSDEGGTIAGL